VQPCRLFTGRWNPLIKVRSNSCCVATNLYFLRASASLPQKSVYFFSVIAM